MLGMIVCLLFALPQCGRDTVSPPTTPAPPNLIPNPTFENQGVPDSTGWFYESFTAHLVQDTPPGGGRWCAEVSPGWVPQEGCLLGYVTGVHDSGLFELGAWARAKMRYWIAELQLVQRRAGRIVHQSGREITVEDWTEFSYVDSLTILPSDTLVIGLCAGSVEVGIETTFFDEVRLKRVE
jgi:hypothetical protein